MLLKLALLASLGLVSAARAVSSSRPEAGLVRRREGSLLEPHKHVAELDDSVSYDFYGNWGGAQWREASGAFSYVSATFTAPTISGPTGSAAAAWVGIDGDTCQSVILNAGIEFGISSDGSSFYEAWYQWWPGYSQIISGFGISPGDAITVTIDTFNTTFGQVTIENSNTGQISSEYLTSSVALCGQNAEWIVSETDGATPLVDFGTVTFSNAVASGPGGIYTPTGAIIAHVEQNNQVLTSASTDGDSVTIQYI